MPPRYVLLDFLKHVMRNVSRFCLHAHTLASVPVLLFKMRCMFFFTVKTSLCVFSERSTRSCYAESMLQTK